MNKTEIKRGRDTYFDCLRGVAILFVVGIHSFIKPDQLCNLSGIIDVSIRQVLSCAVPIFLAISGYFLSKKELKNRADYFKFLKKQIPLVYIPALVWSIPYIIISINHGNTLMVSMAYWLSCSYSIMYFIPLIIQCYLVLPLIKNISHKGGAALLFISALWAYFVGCIFPSFGIEFEYPILFEAGHLLHGSAFFWLGCWYGKGNRVRHRSFVIPLVIVALFYSVIEAYLINDKFGIFLAGQKPSMSIYSFLIIMLMFENKDVFACLSTKYWGGGVYCCFWEIYPLLFTYFIC